MAVARPGARPRRRTPRSSAVRPWAERPERWLLRDAVARRRHAQCPGGKRRALEVCRASEEAVRGVGAWCDENGVDAWFREAPMLRVATTESQIGSWDRSSTPQPLSVLPRRWLRSRQTSCGARCASPLFLGGALYRLNATVHPARLALGLRQKLLERGVRMYERTSVTRLERGGGVATRTGQVRATAAVLAVNSAAPSFPGYRLALAVASSHIVLRSPSWASSTSSAGRAARRSSTAARSSTTRGRRRTAGSCSAGAGAQWAWPAEQRTGSSSIGKSSRRQSAPSGAFSRKRAVAS